MCPFIVGSTTARAGRSIPGSVFKTNREVAIKAPVFPALTQAWAVPFLTRFIATRMEESFLPRKASDGDSSISTTSLAPCNFNLGFDVKRRARNSASIESSIPTRTIFVVGLRWRKSTAEGTVTLGP